MPNRCGAQGIVVQKGTEVGVTVISITSEIVVNNQNVSLPVDISAGMFIPMAKLFAEHRGLVITNDQGACVDEGEIWVIKKGGTGLKFVSDSDDGQFAGTPVENLVGRKVHIKAELSDQVGAHRRLQKVKKLFEK